MNKALKHALENSLDVQPVAFRVVGDGDINDAFAVSMSDGREIFVKTNNSAPEYFFERESQGLAWLAEANSLRVPKVLAISDGEEGMCPFLALEWIATGRRAPDHDELLGRGLANLHRYGAPRFGLAHSNYIGKLKQPNEPLETWADFYANRRLLPQLEMAERAGMASAGLHQKFNNLFARLPDLVGPDEPPARLHGDLWGGNAMQDENGRPCLIDPAVYGGHREVDLAMMRLFGGFSERVFYAYEEAYPLSPGAQERVDLYQLYYLLVHVNLFGRGYLSGVNQAMDRYL